MAAALAYEKIRDFMEADECYAKANASAESHEQMGDYLVRRSLMKMDIEMASENYMKAISHLSRSGSNGKAGISRIYRKLDRFEKVSKLVKQNF